MTAAPSPISTVVSIPNTKDMLVGGLVMDGQGNLYGTTSANGAGGGKADATVFEIASGSNKVTTLATFNGSEGYGLGNLAIDRQGNLFGSAAEQGGVNGNGRVFEIAHDSKAFSVVAKFNGTDGEFPYGVTLDGQGNLFGTTATGYAVGGSTAFEIPRGTGTIHTLATFPTAGAAPKAVVVDGQGNLFGTNATGGPKGIGSVYEIPHGSNTVNVLATFPGLNGSGLNNVVMDGQGDLFGTTTDGGNQGDGTVYEITHGSNTVTRLASFNGLNGSVPNPNVPLVLDGQGNLYGVTASGGAYGDGTVYEIAHGSSRATVLTSFRSYSGAIVSGLMLDGQGNLVGTTDGSGTDGSVFKVALPQAAGTLNPPDAVGPVTVVARKTVKVAKK